MADEAALDPGAAAAGAATHPKDLPRFKDPKGRKLEPKHKRRALRLASQIGLKPYNANHALHLLHARDIDVVEDTDTLLQMTKAAIEKVKTPSKKPAARQADKALTVVPPKPSAPAVQRQPAVPAPAQVSPDVERIRAVDQIQRDLVIRRRKRFFAMFLRLFVFVVLPTAALGYYYFAVASDMYETESKFVIQTSDNPAAGGGLGGLLAGTGFATSQDSVVVQEYLTSREAFARLNRDHNYVRHFQNEQIDFIQRLPLDATVDDAYKYFTKRVTIGYDPTEGLIRMAVVAATPEMSQRFSEALVDYAEERVDGLTLEARGDQLQTATDAFEEAEQRTIRDELRVQELQEQSGVLSAEVELSAQMSIIQALELELETKRLALSQILDNPRPNTSQVAIAQAEIRRLEERIAELRGAFTQSSASSASLSQISRELRSAELRLATSQLLLQEAIAAVTTARTEATRQVRYLSLGVAPVAPQEPTYPKKVENTIIAFFVFLGIYIMASLTVSILREQVSV